MNTRNYTTAYDFLLKDEAGLVLAGKDEDGELVWMGDKNQWARLSYLEDKRNLEEADYHFLDAGF